MADPARWLDRDALARHISAQVTAALSSRALSLALCVALVSACAPESGAPTESVNRDPSQISRCRFRLHMDEGQDVVVSAVSSMARAAVRQMRALGSHSVVYSPGRSAGDPDGAISERSDIAREALTQAGLPTAQIREAGQAIPSGRAGQSGRASVGFHVCDAETARRLAASGPVDPDARVRFALGAQRLAIPQRYLSPFYWADLPFGEEPAFQVSVRFSWVAPAGIAGPAAPWCAASNFDACEPLFRATLFARTSTVDSPAGGNAQHLEIIVNQTSAYSARCSRRRIINQPADNSPEMRSRILATSCSIYVRARSPAILVMAELPRQISMDDRATVWSVVEAVSRQVASFAVE